MSKIKEYMKKNRLTYQAMAEKMGFNIAYVYRVLNKKGNSSTPLVKPSDKFLGKVKINYPAFYQIVKEELLSSKEI